MSKNKTMKKLFSLIYFFIFTITSYSQTVKGNRILANYILSWDHSDSIRLSNSRIFMGVKTGGAIVINPTSTVLSTTNGSISLGSTSIDLNQTYTLNFNAPITNTSARLGVAISLPTAQLHIRGIGTDNTTYALKIENADNSSKSLYVADDGTVMLGRTTALDPLGVGAPNIFSCTQSGVSFGFGSNGGTQGAMLSYNSGASTAFLGVSIGSGGICFGTFTADPYVIRTNNTERLRILGSGGIGIGTPTPDASSVTDMESITQGFLPPQMTTTQKNAIVSPKEGLIVYDITLHKLCVFTTAWETITSL
jgi:hypothetical protein